MAKLYLDVSGRIGLAPKFYGDFNNSTGQPQFRYLGTKDQMAQGVYNPMRKYGYMAPATNIFVALTPSTNSFDNIRTTIFDSTSGQYLLGDNVGNIWTGATAVTYTLTQVGPLGGTAPKILDLEVYQVNGTRKVFYVYQNNSKVDVGIADLPFGSSNDTWYTGTAAGGTTLNVQDSFLIVADNGFAYLCNGNRVDKIDGTSATGGTNGTITPQVLLAPPDFNITDGIDWKGHTWFAMQTAAYGGANSQLTYNERIVGVYVWDRQSTILGIEDFIPVPGAREVRKIFTTRSGKVRLITISSDRHTQLREYNGNTFEVIEELGINAWPQYRDSLTNIGAMTIWLGADGYFYGYGRCAENEKDEQIYILGDTTANLNGSFTSGAILLLDSNSSSTTTRIGVIWSGRTSTPTQYVTVWYPYGEGTIRSTVMTGNAGNVYTLNSMLPVLAKINYIHTYHFPQVTSGSTTTGTLTYYLNQSTSGSAITLTQDDLKKGFKYQIVGKTSIFSIAFKLTFPTTITLGSVDEWLPRLIEVDYEDTTKVQ